MIIGTKLDNGKMIFTVFVNKNKVRLEDLVLIFSGLKDYMMISKN